MQLLVASPRINHTEHDLWRHSVILTFETQSGHMGFIMNQAVANIDHDNISSLYGVGQLPVNRVYCGGPVLTQRCTILHTPEYSVSGTKRVGESAAITFNTSIVEDIVSGRAGILSVAQGSTGSRNCTDRRLAHCACHTLDMGQLQTQRQTVAQSL